MVNASTLDEHRLAAFRDHGYLEVKGLLSAEDCRSARERLEAIEAAGDVPASYEPEHEPEPEPGSSTRRLRKLRRLVWNEPAFWAPLLARCGIPELGRLLVGDEATIVFHAAFLKPALVGTPVALHQDQALWSRTYPAACSVWVALSPVSPANGGLFGCPGSHTAQRAHRASDDYAWHESLDLEADALDAPVQFVLDPGDAIVWDRLFAHGSAANRSAQDRRAMVVVLADGSVPGFDPIDSFPVRELAGQGPAR